MKRLPGNRLVYLALVLGVAALAACTDPIGEYGNLGAAKKAHAAAGDDDDDDAGKSTPSSDSDAAAPASVTPSPAAAPDAGGAASPAIDPFANASPFAEITPAKQSASHHAGQTSNAGKNCMSCHGPGMGAPELAFAGTIQQSKTSATAAVGVQVRVVDSAGAEIASVGTDDSGNFWLEKSIAIPAGARVGIRTGTGEQKMSGPLNTGACNQAGCHSKERPIFLAN